MESLNVTELKDFAAREPDVLLLDVREPWEVALARIALPDVVRLDMPMHTVPARMNELRRSQSIVCICHHGGRSAQVVAFLQRQGYDHVYNLAGGVDAWSTQVDGSVPRY